MKELTYIFHPEQKVVLYCMIALDVLGLTIPRLIA